MVGEHSQMMNRRYRIFIRGDIPKDLRDQIATIYASAVLRLKGDYITMNIRNQKPKNKKGRRDNEDTKTGT
jgi:hypothetical protein